MTTQMVFLVGGRGTRLKEIAKDIPKPLLPVAGKPFIRHLVEDVRRFGITDVILLAGHLGEQIAAHFAQNPVEQVTTRVTIEPQPLGTGGALRLVANELHERFVMANGDSYFGFNMSDLLLPVGGDRWQGTLALRAIEEAGRYGTVTRTGTAITGFREKGHSGPGIINGGIYHFSKSILADIGPGMVSIEQDIFPVLCQRGTLHGKTYRGPFIDIGVPEDLSRANADMIAMLTRPIAFFDRDGVFNIDKGYVHRADQIDWVDGAKKAIKAFNDAGYYTVVVTNQAGVARGYYTEAEVHALHAWMNDELRKSGAHIDRFYHCSFHPDGTVDAFRGSSHHRKPNPGMLEDALRDFRADLTESFIVGDKLSDMRAGEAVGIRGHLFEGGNLYDFLAEREPKAFA
jgi:D-glycero-D-manno-heptose 1,7-bisphosphate phosphatase